MIDVLYEFEQIINTLLNKKDMPSISPLYEYNKDMKDILPAVDDPETVEPDSIEPATEVEASNEDSTTPDPVISEPSETNGNIQEAVDKPLEPKVEDDDDYEDYTIEKKIKKNNLLYDISEDIKNYKKNNPKCKKWSDYKIATKCLGLPENLFEDY